MPDVGVLNLQIKDDSTKAYDSLDKLADALGRVKQAAQGNRMTSLARSMSKVAEAVGQTNEAVAKIDRIAQMIHKLTEAGAGGHFGTVANGIRNITSAINDSGSAVEKIGELADNIQKLKDAGIGFKAPNLNSLKDKTGTSIADSIKQASAGSVDGLQEVTSEVQSVNDAVLETTKSVFDFEKAVSKIKVSPMEEFKDNIKKGNFASWMYGPREMPTTVDYKSYIPPEEDLKVRNPEWYEDHDTDEFMIKVQQELQEYERVQSTVNATREQVEELRRAATETTREIAELISTLNTPLKINWRESIDQMLDIGAPVKSAAESFSVFMQEMQTESEQAAGVRELNPELQRLCEEAMATGRGVSELTSDMTDLDGELKRKKTDTNEARGAFEQLKKSINSMFPGIKKLGSQFARLVKYRVLRAVIKSISEGFQEGVENVYRYSQAIGSSFSASMDSAASSLLQMKNSIGAAVAPAIQALIPYLQMVVNWVITGVNYLNQFFALLRGQQTWTRAVPTTAKAFDDVKKSAKGASAAMKELLADWDELNIIQSESGGGSGAGTNAMQDYLKMFEESSSFDNKIKKLVNDIKDGFGDIWTLVGLIGTALLGLKVSDAFTGTLGQIGQLVAGGATIAIGFMFSYRGAFGLGSDGFNKADLLEMVGGNIASALGGSWIAKAAGYSGVAGAVTGIGIALLIDFIGYVNGLADASDKMKWGENSLTPEEVKAYVESQFKFDVVSRIETLDAVIQNQDDARRALNTAISNFSNSLSKVKIRVDGTPTGIREAQTEAENLIKQLNANLKTSEHNLEVLTKITPITGTSGDDQTNDFLKTIQIADQTLSEYFMGLGKEIAGWIDAGEKSGWKNSEAEMALELMRHQQSIIDQAEQNKIHRDFVVESKVGLSGMTRDTAKDVFEEQERMISEYTEKIKLAYENQVKDLYYFADLADAAGLIDEETGGPLGKVFRESADALLEQIKNGDIYEEAIPSIEAMRDEWVETLRDIYGDASTESLDVKGFWDSIFGGKSVFDKELYKEYIMGGTEDAANYVQKFVDGFFDGVDPTGITKKASELFGFNLFDILEPESKNYVISRITEALGGDTGIAYDILHAMGISNESIAEALKTTIEEEKPDIGIQVNPSLDEEDLSITELMEDVKKETDSAATGVENDMARIRDAFASLNGIQFNMEMFGRRFGGGVTVTVPVIGQAANGGIFTSGDIFSANENGNAEYIGRYGNSTAVVNNGQIIEGITTGVASGQEEQNSLLRRQNEILLQLLNKQFVAKVSASSGLGRVNSQSGAMYERMAGG